MINNINSGLPMPIENVTEMKGPVIKDLMHSELNQNVNASDDDEQKKKEACMQLMMDNYVRELLYKTMTEKPDEWEF